MFATISGAPPLAPARAQTQELRIDVSLPEAQLIDELASLRRRLGDPRDPLHGLPRFRLGADYRVSYREADGEYYLYIQHWPSEELAGYVVFNRLIELARRADRHLRAPHAKLHPRHRRRGIAGALYRHVLDSGMCLITGARQSAAAHALWQGLARTYPHGYVELQDKQLGYLGRSVDEPRRSQLHTRMVLLGAGWGLPDFAHAVGMRTAVQDSRRR